MTEPGPCGSRRRTPAAILAAATLALCLGSGGTARAQPAVYPFTVEGKVVSVTDGDTIKVLVGRSQLRIRLNGIDAPEYRQAYGRKSKDYLASLVAGKRAEVIVRDTDRYGRWVGDVLVDGKSANAQMVAAGMAWFYAAYSKDENLAELEREARAEGRGLWADPGPTPPWEFRRLRRTRSR